MTELCSRVIELTPFKFYPWTDGDSFDGNTGTAFGGTFKPWTEGAILNGGSAGYYEPNLEIELPFFTTYPWNETPSVDGGEMWDEVTPVIGGTFEPWNSGAMVDGGTSGYYTPNLEVWISL